MFAPNCVVLVPNPELAIKSAVVRAFMNKKLKKNIQLYLKQASIEEVKFNKFGGRLVLYHSEPKKIIDSLLTCLGIHSMHLAQAVEFSELVDLCDSGAKISEGNVPEGTFAVRGKSFSKQFSSKKLEEELGAKLLASIKGLKVKLTSPKSEVFCIAQDNKAYFYFAPIIGAKGMPVGCQRRACVILNKSGKASDKEIFELVYNILKSGSTVCFVGDKELSQNLSDKLVPFNSFRLFRQVSISEAKELLAQGELEAFFSFAKSKEEADSDSELVDVKVFAPFIGGATRFSTIA
jgi:hypothetical protein